MLSVTQRRFWSIVAFFVMTVIVLGLIFLKGTYTKICDDDECFSNSLASCTSTEYTKVSTDATWYYHVQGLEGDKCNVYVKLSQLRKGSIEIVKLEGKDMNCYLPYTVVESPQKNLELCHGLLKEEIQALLIQKMHSYLLENLGKINQEFTSVI
ncbi:MAG: hypothetical protein AABW73_00160 [Nanoarchaeota archaeon]